MFQRRASSTPAKTLRASSAFDRITIAVFVVTAAVTVAEIVDRGPVASLDRVGAELSDLQTWSVPGFDPETAARATYF